MMDTIRFYNNIFPVNSNKKKYVTKSCKYEVTECCWN